MDIILNGEVGVEITLYDTVGKVKEAMKSNPEMLTVFLTTVGGDSEEGREIAKYFRSLNIPKQIIARDYVYSSGISIMCGFDNRKAETQDVQFLMHTSRFLPFYEITSDDLTEMQSILDEDIKKLQKLYSEAFDIPLDTVLALMEQDRIIDTETAKSIGIIQDVISTRAEPQSYKIAAKYYPNNNYKLKLKSIMNEKELKALKEEQEKGNTLLQKLVAFFDKKPKAIEVNTEEGIMLNFDAESFAEVGEGTVLINEVEDGTYTIITETGKYSVEISNNVVVSKTEVEAETEMEAKIKELEKQNAELQEQLQAKKELEQKLEAKETELADVTAKNQEFEKMANELKAVHSKLSKEVSEFKVQATDGGEPDRKTKVKNYIEKEKEKNQ